MKTKFVTLTIALHPSPAATRLAIEAALQNQGGPLRWAIIAVDTQQQQVQVEGIVTIGAEDTEDTKHPETIETTCP
jgi:hypothetical protein